MNGFFDAQTNVTVKSKTDVHATATTVKFSDGTISTVKKRGAVYRVTTPEGIEENGKLRDLLFFIRRDFPGCTISTGE